MHLNTCNLSPRTWIYGIWYKSRTVCKNVGNMKTIPAWAEQNITSNKWKFKSESNTTMSHVFNKTRRVRQTCSYLQSSFTFYIFHPTQADNDLATEVGIDESYRVNPKLYEHLFSMRCKHLTADCMSSPTACIHTTRTIRREQMWFDHGRELLNKQSILLTWPLKSRFCS